MTNANVPLGCEPCFDAVLYFLFNANKTGFDVSSPYLGRVSRYGTCSRASRAPGASTDKSQFHAIPGLRSAPTHRRWVSRQGKAAKLGQRVAVEAQDVNVAINEIADIEKVPVGAKGDAFGEATDIGLFRWGGRPRGIWCQSSVVEIRTGDRP
jgi:hypothetical protein